VLRENVIQLGISPTINPALREIDLPADDVPEPYSATIARVSRSYDTIWLLSSTGNPTLDLAAIESLLHEHGYVQGLELVRQEAELTRWSRG
jgi:hypothetical protein